MGGLRGTEVPSPPNCIRPAGEPVDSPMIAPTSAFSTGGLPETEAPSAFDPFRLIPSGALYRLGRGSISDIAISPDGTTLAVGTALGIYYHDLDRMRVVRFDPTEGPVTALSFSQSQNVLASALWDGGWATEPTDGIIVLWDAGSGERLREISAEVVHSRREFVSFKFWLDMMDFSSHGGYDFAFDYWLDVMDISSHGELLASDELPGKITIREWETGKVLHLLDGQVESITHLAFSPAGALLASVSEDGRVFLWDPIQGNLLRMLRDPGDGWQPRVDDIAWSPDGEFLAFTSLDGVEFLATQGGTYMRGFLEKVMYDLAISPDGSLLAAGSFDGIKVWSLDTCTQLRSIPTQYNAESKKLIFSPDGRTLISLFDNGTAAGWDPRTGEMRWILEDYRGPVFNVAFSPDDKALASASELALVLWDVNSGERLGTVSGFDVWPGEKFPLKGDTPVATSEIQRLWDGEWLPRISQVFIFEGRRDSVAMSPDGNVRAAKAPGIVGPPQFHHPRDGVMELYGGPLEEFLSAGSGVGGDLEAVVFSPDGGILAASFSEGPVTLWDVRTGDILRAVMGGSPDVSAASLAFSSDGEVLALGLSDGSVTLVEVRTGERLNVLVEHHDWVSAMSYSPDGEILASGYADGAVVLWDPWSGTELRVLQGHQGPINNLAYSSDGSLLASGSQDGTVVLWEMEAR